METRKIQTVGGGTYTVSVPKDWAQKQDLETGEAVRLYNHRDGSLIVRGKETDAKALESVRFLLGQESPAHLEEAIRTGYTAGFERIHLIADEPFTEAHRRTVQALTRQLVGANVVEPEPTEIVVRAMLDSSAVSVHQSVEQAVSIVTAMQQTVIDGLTDGTAVAEQVRDRKPDVERLVTLVRRHYNRSLVSFEELDALGLDRVPLAQYERTANRIQQMATTTVRLAATIDERDPNAETEKLAECLGTFISYFNTVIERVLKQPDEGTKTDGNVDTGRRPIGDLLTENGQMDPWRKRVVDFLRRLADHLQTIEYVSMQSVIRDDPSVTVDVPP